MTNRLKLDRKRQQIERILNDASELINTSGVLPRTKMYLDIIVLGVTSKAIAVGWAICVLVRQGFHEVAYCLLIDHPQANAVALPGAFGFQ